MAHWGDVRLAEYVRATIPYMISEPHVDSTTVDALIVGGGPCGLTVALGSARRGLSTRLIEADPHVGGMAASFSVGGQRVDLGSHRLHPVMPTNVEVMLRELLGCDLQERERNGRLRLRDEWVLFPFRARNLIANVPPSIAATSVADLAFLPLHRPREDTYAEVVRAGLGQTALREFHGPMAEKIWGLPPEELSGELARRRLSVRTPGSLLRTVSRTSRPKGRTFLYPRLGYGQIVEQLERVAVTEGARLSTGVSVQYLQTGSEWTRSTLSNGEVVVARRVFWTASTDALRMAVDAAPSTEQRCPPRLATMPGGDVCANSHGDGRGDVCGNSRGDGRADNRADNRVDGRGDGGGDGGGGVRARSMVLVYLVIDRPSYTEFDAHYVPDPAVCFSRLSEPRNYRQGPDPSDRTVLCAEIPCTLDDEIWRASDAALAELVIDGLSECDLPAAKPIEVAVKRLGSVYPVLRASEAGHRAKELDWAHGLEGVTVLGRQALMVADNIHHVLDMALSAVACIRGDSSWNSEGWARHLERFDGFVVQD